MLTLTGDRICAITRFEASVLPWFGLPRSLPAGGAPAARAVGAGVYLPGDSGGGGVPIPFPLHSAPSHLH